MLTAITFAAIAAGQQAPVEMARAFKKGQNFAYEVRSHLLAEERNYQLSVFMPSELDINYDCNYTVTDLKPGGFAKVLYKRPYITEIQGETADSPPKTNKVKVDYVLELDLSPINEVTNVKDLNPPKPEKPGGGGGIELRQARAFSVARSAGVSYAQSDIIRMFTGELYNLALFIGDLSSSLDFSPKFHYESVSPGETWKRTVSYQPQQIKGSKDKQAMQRLDMTYTYQGMVESRGKTVHRVTSVVNLDTDVALYIFQITGVPKERQQIQAWPMKLETKLQFDLDPQTYTTLYGVANTTASWHIDIAGLDIPVLEEKITGKATVKLAAPK